eukprot:1361807-Rhodomonas_salina.1
MGDEVNEGEELEWLEALEREKTAFDHTGIRLWTGRMEHSKLTGRQRQVGIKSLGLNQWVSQE